MIEAELFDGTILEFDPNTSPDVIQRVVREQTAARRSAAPAAPMGGNDPTGLLATIMKDRDAAPAAAAPAGPTIRQDEMPLETGLRSVYNSAPVQKGMALTTQLARGAREGLANIAGMPVDLAALLTNAGIYGLNQVPGVNIPYATNPVGGSKFMDQKVLSLGGAIPEAPAPRDMSERVARRFGQEAGASAGPVAGGLVAASRMTVNEARNLPALARMFVEPAAVSPGKFVQGNAAGAAMAATGASVANELTGNINKETGTYDPGLTDLLGAVGGVGAGSTVAALARPVGTAVSAVFNRPQFIDGVVKQTAAEEIARAAGVQPGPKGVVNTDPLVDQIMQGRRIGDTVPGYTESLADRTRNPGLAAMEYGRQTGENSGVYAQLRQSQVEAVDNAMQATKPQESPAAFRSELETQRDMKLAGSQQTLEQAQAKFDEAARALEPMNPNAEARGATIRSGVENAERAAREVEQAAYRGITGAVDPAPLAEAFQRVSDNIPEAYRSLASGVQDVVSIPSNAQGALDLREIVALRSRLTTEQRNAVSGPQPDTNKARVIGDYVDALDSAAAQGLPPDVLAQWDRARGISRQVNERFNRPNDPVAAVLSRREGRPDVPDSGVGQQFIRPDRGQASNLDRVLAETDLTSQGGPVFGALQDELRADALRRGVTQKPERAEGFVREFGAAADRLGVKGDIQQVGQTGRAAQDAQRADEALRRELGTADKPGTGTVGRFLQYGPEKADQAMATVMSSKDPARAADELIAFVGNDAKAVEGARRAFWDHMERKTRRSGETTATPTGTQPWMQGALKRFLDDPANAAVAERLYKDNPEHLQRIREIADALQGTETRNFAKAPNTSGTPQALNPSNLPTAETIASRVFAVERGVVSPLFAGLNVVGIMARKATKAAQVKAVNMAIDKALTDPDWAAQLLKENNPANRAALAKSARAWMGNQASTFINMMDDTEEDPIVKKAMER